MASLTVLVAIAPVSLQNYVIEDFLIIREIGEDQSHHAMTQPINATRRLRTPTTHAWKFASLSCCDQGWNFDCETRNFRWKWIFRKNFSICSQKVSDTQCFSPGHVLKPKSKSKFPKIVSLVGFKESGENWPFLTWKNFRWFFGKNFI